MRERFQFKEHFPRTSSSPATIEETNTDSPVSSSADEVVFGLGGLLKPKPGDPYQFNLALDGTTMVFQLSLCGSLGGIDEVEDERWFESQRVSWRKFMARKQIAKHDDLVILWDDKYVSFLFGSYRILKIEIRYVTREDASPLFGALLHWRDNTVSSQGYTSDGEPLSSGDELSEDENELPVVPPGRSTWSRWFGRGWSEKPRIEDLKSDRLQPPQRPAIQTTISDPTDVRLARLSFLVLNNARSSRQNVQVAH
jgi:phosphatidate phosphatase LPIN